MKKTITLLGIFLFCTFSISSQMRKEGRKKIKALKIAFITEQLNLTENEAEKFWPVYNAYNKEQSSIRSNYKTTLRNTIKKESEIDSLKEIDAKELISLKLKTDKNLYESQKSFTNKIVGIIPYKKIIKLQIAEMEFGRKLMRKYKHRGIDKKN